jgi:hypothetical protein
MVRKQVQPLRIQKGTSGSLPSKMGSATNRTLAEVSPMAIRRNSPSFPQGNKVRFINPSYATRHTDSTAEQHVQEWRILPL